MACGLAFLWGFKAGENRVTTHFLKTVQLYHPDDPGARSKLLRTMINVREGIQ